jgi:hypothetical protein
MMLLPLDSTEGFVDQKVWLPSVNKFKPQLTRKYAAKTKLC